MPPYHEPARPPRDDATPIVPPSHVLRPLLERLRASAIAEANEIGKLLGLPSVRQERGERGRRE